MGVSLNGGFTPQIIHFNRVFHYFHHPFWGTPIFGNTHIPPGGFRKIFDSKVPPWYGIWEKFQEEIFSFPSDHECHAFEIPDVIFHVYVEQQKPLAMLLVVFFLIF